MSIVVTPVAGKAASEIFYQVISLKNSTEFLLQQTVKQQVIDDLISAGWDVTIK